MADPVVYPLTFTPVFKDYPWGGRNLATKLGRTIPDGVVAESWEIAAHANGASLVANGEWQGATLQAVQDSWSEALVGRANRAALARNRFPLLIKLLDANRWLSVQVHPDDAYAAQHGGDLGKTEMWVVLQAEPGAELVYGFKAGVDREQFAQAIAHGTVEEWLHRVAVQPGDVIFVPSGTVHALGPGIIVAEIQQNSDTTYRIYDWGRPRPIHVEQALEVLNFDMVEPALAAPKDVPARAVKTELLADCPYFRTERLHMKAGEQAPNRCDGETFEIWGILSGAADLTWHTSDDANPDGDCCLRLDAIGWTLLPAALGDFAVTAAEDATLLRIFTSAV